MNIMDYLGDHSVEFAQIISLVCLFYSVPKYLWLSIYILGFFISTFINRTLKKWIDPKMPSGHFQSIFYSATFVFLVLRETNPVLFSKFWKHVAALYLIVAFLCFYNCIEFHYHSILQIISGSAVGSGMAILIHRLGLLFFNSQ